MELELKPANNEDVTFAWSVFRDFVRDNLFSGAPGRRKPADWDDSAELGKFSSSWSEGNKYLITVDGSPIGWASIRVGDEKVVIENWHVDAAWQRKRVGSIILGDLVARWKAQGKAVEASLLLDSPTTEGAQKLAEKLGLVQGKVEGHALSVRAS